MDIRIWKLFVAAFVGLSHVCCAGDLYRLEVHVERNGLTVADTTADVEAGDTADLQISAGDIQDPVARVIANVMPEPSSNDVAVHLQYLEKRNENWVLLGEPSVVAALGDDVGVEFSEDTASTQPNRYKVLLSLDNLSDSLAGQSVERSEGCIGGITSLVHADGANPKCCSTKAMTCCNVKHCCDSRPGHGDCCDIK